MIIHIFINFEWKKLYSMIERSYNKILNCLFIWLLKKININNIIEIKHNNWNKILKVTFDKNLIILKV